MYITITDNITIFLSYIPVEEGDGTRASWFFHIENYKGFKGISIFGCCVCVRY